MTSRYIILPMKLPCPLHLPYPRMAHMGDTPSIRSSKKTMQDRTLHTTLYLTSLMRMGTRMAQDLPCRTRPSSTNMGCQTA